MRGSIVHESGAMRQLSTDLRRPNQTYSNGRPRRYSRPNLPPLFYSIIGRNWVQALRRTTTHPKEIFSVEDVSGDSPLHIAVKLDPPLQVVMALLPICNEKNREGATALHVAASHRCSAAVIKIMLETKFAGDRGALALSLSNRGRTPLHYACSSFRGLDVEAFRLLLEATIEAHVEKEKIASDDKHIDGNNDDEFDWEDNTERSNAFTMQDDLGYTPLSLLFKRYKERVKYVIRSLERKSISSSTSIVQEELGSLWLKARLIVCLMAEKQKDSMCNSDIFRDDTCLTEDAVAEEAARWAAQRHQTNNDLDNEDEEEDFVGKKFLLVHASVALTGYGCPIEMIRLSMSVYPHQIMQMDESGNLPLHIAAVASTFLPDQSLKAGSDEDSFVSSLSALSGISNDSSNPFRKVIRMLLRFYPESAQIPHGVSGRLPLILAMDAGQRSMDDGIKVLFEAYPAALESKEFDPKLYPYILSSIGKAKQEKPFNTKLRFPRFGRKKKECAKKNIPTALYECLKAKPNLVLHSLLGDKELVCESTKE